MLVRFSCLLDVTQLVCLKSYWVLAVCYGGGMGLLSALVTILDQLLLPQGYNDVGA